MERRASRKRRAQTPEDDKQNESILEEVLSISGKNVEVADEKDGEEKNDAPPARLKRSETKSKEKTVNQSKKVNAKKAPASPPSLPPSKQKKPTDKEKEAVAVVEETKTTERGDPVPNLPDGWRRQSIVRRSGKTAGQIDIYFYSPEGIKLRSRPDVSSYLAKHKSDLKVEEFDFSKTMKPEAVVKKKAVENSTTPKKKSKTAKDHEEKLDEVESKQASTKAISSKKSKSSEKSSTKVPPSADTEEKNDVDGKSNKVLIKILESKPKKSRK